MEDQCNFGHRKPDIEILQERDKIYRESGSKYYKKHFLPICSYPSELSEPSTRKPVSVIDQMAEIQKIINKQESEICDIMSIPAGARLLNWSYIVEGTWWYRLFSRIDGTFKKRIARLS